MEKLFSVASVMVIDDEAFALYLVSEILEGMGIGEVITADNGAQAIEALEQRDGDLNLIVCDVEMPEMDGYEFVRKLRYGVVPRFKDIPVVVLTGQDTDKNVQHARILKIDGFVVKPPDKSIFERKVREIIKGQLRKALDSDDA